MSELIEANEKHGAELRLLLEVDVLSEGLAEARLCLEQASGLPATLWLRNASGAEAERLEPWLALAVSSQVECICVSDSQGLLTPEGVGALLQFVQHFCLSRSAPTRLEWHGGNQGGQALANGLAAVEAGADKVHASLSDCRQIPMQHLLLHLHQMAGRRLGAEGFRSYLSWARTNLGWIDSEGLEARIPETIAQETVTHR